ncbi:hypothetical protein ACIP2X_08930 [Streptomyces sp. NPDC089424]|uniref:hypothetical protein n=1 Tax=Streptomyces sp. NPDC089424 TaxID=3365917 RepID=UPI0038302A61
MTHGAEPDPVLREEDIQNSLDSGYFTRCPKCGRISFLAWVIHEPRFRLRLCQWRRHCRHEPVTREQVRAFTGMSERDLLRLMYSYLKSRLAGNASKKIGAEVERRLGLSPVRPTEVSFGQVRTDSVDAALRILTDEALPAVPVICQARAEAEHEPLTRGYRMGPLRSGPPEDATAVLRAALEHEQHRPDFRYFQIEVEPAKFCVQLDSKGGDPIQVPGKPLFAFAGYRVWRGADQLFLCAHENAVL